MIRFLCTFLFIVMVVATEAQSSQPAPLAEFIASSNLHPAKAIDTVSESIPADLVTASGWHLDYYASYTYGDGVQLNIYELIYKDSIYTVSMYTCDPRHPRYNYYELTHESDTYLYFTIQNAEVGDNLWIVSKTKGNITFQLTNLVYKDFDHDMFVETMVESLRSGEQLHVRASRVEAGIVKDIVFKGRCEDEKQGCIDSIRYDNGMLSITAIFRDKQKQLAKQTKTIKI